MLNFLFSPQFTTIVALVAPIATAAINNIYQYRINRFSSSSSDRLKIYFEFINNFSAAQKDPSDFWLDALYKTIFKLAGLCGKRKTRKLLLDLAFKIQNDKFTSETLRLYQECIKALSKEL